MFQTQILWFYLVSFPNWVLYWISCLGHTYKIRSQTSNSTATVMALSVSVVTELGSRSPKRPAIKNPNETNQITENLMVIEPSVNLFIVAIFISQRGRLFGEQPQWREKPAFHFIPPTLFPEDPATLANIYQLHYLNLLAKHSLSFSARTWVKI